jgi:hypothetical protein
MMTSDSKQPSGQQGPSQVDEPGAAAPRSGGSGRDALGIALLVISFFVGAAVVMAYLDPKEEASGVTGMVMALVDTLGIAAMFLSLGLCWIGIRLFMRGIDGKLARDLGGVVLTTLTLAVLVGALSPELGGSVGDLGAMVTRQMSAQVGVVLGTAIGALFGLIVVLLPAWGLWIRPAAIAAGELPRSSAPLAPRASDSSGVSQAEAEGLFPKAAARAALSSAQPSPFTVSSAMSGGAAGPLATPLAERATRERPTPENTKLSPPKVVAPSPYPPDVRREGRVPEGARPLGAAAMPFVPAAPRPELRPEILPENPQVRPVPSASAAAPTAHEPRHEPVPAEDPRHAASLRARDHADAGGRPLGREAELHARVQPPVADVHAGQRGPVQQPAAGSAGAAASGHAPLASLNAGAPTLERETAEEPETYADALARAVNDPTVAPLERTPPAPSWEQSDLFEEPVDAYGTPLSLVESLRKPEAAPEPAPRAEEAGVREEKPWGDEPLDDEAFEESVKPLAVNATAPEAVVEAAPAAEAAAPEPERQAPRVEVSFAAVESDEELVEQAPQAAAVDPEAPEAPAEGSRDDLRAELRGFIDLRGARRNAEREAELEAASAEAATEPPEAVESAATRDASVRAAVNEQVEAAPVELAHPEPAPVELPAPAEAPLAEAATRVAAQDAGESADPSTDRSAHDDAAAKHAPAKPAVVIRSLFGEDEPPAAAPESAASAPDAEAEVPHDEAAASEVVLEPARKPKRKSKPAARPESSALAAEHAGREAPNEPSEPATAPAVASEPQARELALGADRATESEPESAPESEPQVELTPAAPRSRSRLTVDEIVFKAGCLFVERQRVAVSMLQREFGLDFDAATSVLDQLQRAGLIGPYLGGQRRDILLTMDEWQELVAVE